MVVMLLEFIPWMIILWLRLERFMSMHFAFYFDQVFLLSCMQFWLVLVDLVLIVVFSVEKVEDGEASKSSSSGRNKKPVTKKVMEYCYEPEMEEVTFWMYWAFYLVICYFIKISNVWCHLFRILVLHLCCPCNFSVWKWLVEGLEREGIMWLTVPSLIFVLGLYLKHTGCRA